MNLKDNYIKSIDDNKKVDEINNKIASLQDTEYRNYAKRIFSTKLTNLRYNKKLEEDKQREEKKKQEEQKKLEEQQKIAEQKRQEEMQKEQEAKKQKEEQAKQASVQTSTNSNSNNTNTEDRKGRTVYVASSCNGDCYHSRPQCGRMKNSYVISKSRAETSGYRPCKKCYR